MGLEDELKNRLNELRKGAAKDVADFFNSLPKEERSVMINILSEDYKGILYLREEPEFDKGTRIVKFKINGYEFDSYITAHETALKKGGNLIIRGVDGTIEIYNSPKARTLVRA